MSECWLGRERGAHIPFMGPQPIPDQRPFGCSLNIGRGRAAPFRPYHPYNIPRTTITSSSACLSLSLLLPQQTEEELKDQIEHTASKICQVSFLGRTIL